MQDLGARDESRSAEAGWRPSLRPPRDVNSAQTEGAVLNPAGVPVQADHDHDRSHTYKGKYNGGDDIMASTTWQLTRSIRQGKKYDSCNLLHSTDHDNRIAKTEITCTRRLMPVQSTTQYLLSAGSR